MESLELLTFCLSQSAIFQDSKTKALTLAAKLEKELTPEHTHLEISPLCMLGLVTTLVPFGDYIQSARLSIGSKNQKHAIGFYASNFGVRMDMDVNLMHTPQVPIVQSMMHDLCDYDKHPSGQNIVIAVMAYKGYNIEDAVI